jgi:hypothetical protein
MTSCSEVNFADGRCRIEIANRTEIPDMPLFVARMWLVERDGHASHPLVDADGSAVEVHGQTEALALNTAMSYLERKFGALSGYQHGCADGFTPTPEEKTPLVVEGREHGH